MLYDDILHHHSPLLQRRACALVGISSATLSCLSPISAPNPPTGFPCKPSYICNPLFVNVFQAAFDLRVLSAVCFFATDIHGATLGKGGDDSLARVRAGELTGKGELVV
jgi:hypothetical protein